MSEQRSDQRISLVTGANRGIGLEVCRQLAEKGDVVYLGSRDLDKGQQAAQELKQAGLNVEAIQLDVTDSASVEQAVQQIEQRYARLDVLVNNAAILYDTWENILDTDLDTMQQAFETNTLAALRMAQACLPLLRKSSHGRIVNVSSEAGSLASIGTGSPAYNLSKVGLNAITLMLSKALRRDHILVNAVCPGWVATDMGGRGGRPVKDGAASVLWAVTLPDNGPTGGFFRDGKPVPW
jgi:NAD(P)-dependent dehydrogenase (short-subunit alcohol dehydrogenase family)